MNFRLILVIVTMLMSVMAAMAYTIYPTPRGVEMTGSTINLGSQVNIVTSNSGAKYVTRLKEVLANAGLSYTVSTMAKSGMVDVYIGVYGSSDVADNYASTLSDLNRSIFPSTAGRYDPHILRIDTDSDSGAILLLGDADGSAYYGCASLEQMLEQASLESLPTVKIADYAHAKYRGIMEGFYGHPYSMESRLNLLEYCKRYKMNYYGYGPKADPYHAGNWRLNYPETVTEAQRNLGQLTSSDMATIAAKAKECNVDFVWIIHPSLGSYSINLSWVPEIMTKFEHLYELGVRHFGVSVDDMNGHPSNQGQLAAEVQAKIDAKWNTDATPKADRVGPVLFTPTVYALNYGSSYVLQSFKNIDSKIDVAFTGYDCFSNVRASSFATMANYIGRDPVFWWNNPVNDDYDEFLYLHGLTARWFIEQEGPVNNMKGFLLNPMNQGQASKVCLFSGADYAWNPAAFDAQSSWEASLYSIVKTEENVQALRDFIDIVSAYVTRDTKTPEGEKYAELYSQFKVCLDDFEGVESLAEVEELYTVMTRTVEACDHLSQLANSSDDDCRLFWVDIEPWALKVREMASIIVDTFDALRGEVDYDRWTQVSNIAKRASEIHSKYTLSVLEGSGTSTNEKFKEVQPTPTHLDPLIDFIAENNFSVTLPARDRTPEVVTNFSDDYNCGSVSFDNATNKLLYSGYQDAEWETGHYVGINFNRLQSICVNEIEISEEFSELQLQYSVNGKNWCDVPNDLDEYFEAAYIRLVNSKSMKQQVSVGGEVKMPLSSLDAKLDENDGEFKITASTNMGTYSGYVIDNIIDGNPSTYYWSTAPPAAGSSYIMLSLGTLTEVSGVTLQFNQKDKPSGLVLIQTSKDGITWIEKDSFTSSDIAGDNKYSITFEAEDARFVRLFFQTVTTRAWFQLAEFEVAVTHKNDSTPAKESVAVAFDNQQQAVSVLDDRKLTTGYRATSAGQLIYRFTENLKIDEVLVFHNSSFSSETQLPTISMCVDGQWHDCGVLDNECTHISSANHLNIEQLRIEWTADNCPDIYEIMPVGEHFDANKYHAGICEIVLDDVNGIGISASSGNIIIDAATAIKSVVIYDTAGRTIATYKGTSKNSINIKMPLSSPNIVLVQVTTIDGNFRAEKVAVMY